MALKPLYSNREPVGFYDGVDSELSSYKGGEVVGLTYVSVSGSDVAAADVADGYVSFSQKKRPAVTKSLVSGMRPLFLADEGTSGYGTLFGQLVGSSAGTVVSTGTVLGPNTTAGSGKVTCWQGPGHYAVTLDAVSQGALHGLQPTNTSLVGGDPLYATSAGLLTPYSSDAFEVVPVGYFVEFTSNGSKVTTPHSLISALNSPSGNSDYALLNSFTQAVIYFNHVS